MACWIDRFAMALVFDAARGAGPDVFVGNGVGVFGGDVDILVGERRGAFLGPGWERRG